MADSLVSIVIPCFRSAPYLAKTVEGIRRALSENAGAAAREDAGRILQVILVNDGSDDGTFKVIEGLCGKHPWIVGIDLDRNYGQGIAKTAGIPFISGKRAIFMDDDGQDDPSAIPRLLDKVDEGFDLVYAQFGRKHESPWRLLASFANNLALSLATDKPRDVTITSFFALSSDSIEYLKGLDRYAGNIGFTLFPHTRKVTGIPVEHLARAQGESTYSFWKLFAQQRLVIAGSKRVVLADACTIRAILNDPRESGDAV